MNTAVIIPSTTDLLQRSDPSSLECSGSSIMLMKSWAKYSLQKVTFLSKR